MTDYSKLPLHTPERIRYNKAAAAKDRAKRAYNEARAAYRAAGETYRAALAEEISARHELLTSQGTRHGTNTD
jgi:hypothetical protein